MEHQSRQSEFLSLLFRISYDGNRLTKSRFKREELGSIYQNYFAEMVGFSEAMDLLVFEKMLGMEVSPSKVFTEYYLTRLAVEHLAANNNSLSLLVKATEIALSPEQKQLLTNDLDQAIRRIDDLELSQVRRAQIRSLLLAARTLSEAPEPPVDIIKALLSNADRIINIAGFFIGVAGLILGLL